MEIETRLKVRTPGLVPFEPDLSHFGESLAKMANGDTKAAGVETRWIALGYQGEQSTVSMLKRWIKKAERPTPAIIKEVRGHLDNMQPGSVTPTTRASRNGLSMAFEVDFGNCSSAEVVSYMYASLMNAGWTENLRQCPHCDTYFFHTPNGKIIPTYCSRRCQNAANQRAWRERQRAKRQAEKA